MADEAQVAERADKYCAESHLYMVLPLGTPSLAWHRITPALVFIIIDVAVMAGYAHRGATTTRIPNHRFARLLERTGGSFLMALGIALAFVRPDEV